MSGSTLVLEMILYSDSYRFYIPGEIDIARVGDIEIAIDGMKIASGAFSLVLTPGKTAFIDLVGVVARSGQHIRIECPVKDAHQGTLTLQQRVQLVREAFALTDEELEDLFK